jgi:hypothetical protein
MQVSGKETISISGINALDVRALRKLLPEGTVRFPSPELAPSQHGDLGTTAAIVILTAMSIKTLAAWLVQNRQKSRIKLSRTRTNPDGSSEIHEWLMESSSSDSESEVVRQLLAGLEIDPGALRDERSEAQ